MGIALENAMWRPTSMYCGRRLLTWAPSRRVAGVVLGLIGIAVVVAAAAIVLVATIDLRPWIERYATWSLDRRLTIGTLRIGWGDPLSLEIADLRLANAASSASADMVRIERIAAGIDLLSLIRGVWRFESLDITRPEFVLERDANGIGNWRFGAAASPGDRQIAPNKRAGSPVLIDFRLRSGRLTYRTSSGAVLRSDLQDLTIRSAGDDTPVSLVLDGAYNDTPVRLRIETQSFTVLRNASVPFGLEASAATPTAEIDFKGTMMQPFDVDGVQGSMRIDARDLGDLLSLLGADIQVELPIVLNGTFGRTGNHWELSDAKGKLMQDEFEGSLTLDEGGRGEPDEVGIAASFARLDLTPILADDTSAKNRKGRAAPSPDHGTLSLEMEAKRGTHFDAQLVASAIAFRAMRLSDFRARGRLASDQASVNQMSFSFAGGVVEASGAARRGSPGSRVTANASVSGAESGQIAKMLGAEAGQIAGKITGRATLEMTGITIDDALKASHGHAVLVMKEGRIARALLEKLSTDLRSLFRRDERLARISCLLGVIDMRDGRGAISQLRLQTPATALLGGGQVDFLRQRLDLTIKSVSATTSFFALDIPLRISGRFTQLRVEPVVGSSARWLDARARQSPAHDMPSELQQLIESSACPR